MPMNLKMETERLILHTFQDHDIQPFSTSRSDPQVARFQGWQAPFNLKYAIQFVQELHVKTPRQACQWYQLALELKESGQMISNYTFHISSDGRQAEIDTALALAHQSKSFALETERCLLDYLFSQHEVHRVFANVDPRNASCKHIMKNLDLRFEGHFIQSMYLKGEWVDEV